MSRPKAEVVRWPEDIEGRYAVVERAVQVLHGGGLLVYPTDTVYGLGADPAFPQSIRRIFEVKGRPDERAIIWLVASVDGGRSVCFVDERAERLAEVFWPGALTLVLPRRVPPEGELLTLGVRVPAHPARSGAGGGCRSYNRRGACARRHRIDGAGSVCAAGEDPPIRSN